MQQTRRFIVLLTALMLASGASAQLSEVKQAGFRVMSMAVPFVADVEGFFERNGVAWEYVEMESGALGVAALISGDVQITDLPLSDVITLQERGRDPVLIYSLVNALTMDLVVRNDVLERLNVNRDSPLEERLQALQGLTIGITRPGAVTQLFPQYFLTQMGLHPERDATFVQIGGGVALVAAMEAGQIDAFMLSPPAPYMAESRGFATVLIRHTAGEGLPEFADFDFTSAAVLRSWAEANRDVVESYITALNEAHAWMIDNFEDAVDALQTYFPETERDVLALSLNAELDAVRIGGMISREGLENQVNVFREIGLLDVEPDLTEGVLWTNEFNTFEGE
jgi:NitT/TauT family transport system substrate-binding protein